MNLTQKNSNKSNQNFILLTVFLIIGQVFIIFAPFLFAQQSVFIDFDSSTGSIGDTIGGSTAPIIGSINIIIVYLALRTQIKANSLMQAQINNQYKIENIRYLTEFITNERDMFKYSNLVGLSAVNRVIEKLLNNNDITDSEFEHFVESLLQTCLACKNEILSIENEEIKETQYFIFSKQILEKFIFNMEGPTKNKRLQSLIEQILYNIK